MKKQITTALAFLFAAIFTTTLAQADTINWTGATDSDWHTATNWDNVDTSDNSIPGSGDTAYINVDNNLPVQVTQDANLYNTYVGDTGPGSLTVNNAVFDLNGRSLNVGTNGGTGTFTQTGANAATPDVGYLFLGRYSAEGSGTMNIEDGTIKAGTWRVGNNVGTGTLNLTGGSSATVSNTVSNNIFMIGGGSYDNELNTGSGTGTVTLGDATSGGNINYSGGNASASTSLLIRNSSASAGTLQGWGTVTTAAGDSTLADYDGMIVNNGQVIANGFGTDRTLDLTGVVNGVDNYIENGTAESNGWYAENQGKLSLTPLAVTDGASSVNWGEADGDTTIDLVNSARLTFSDATAGNVTGSLLSTDRTTESVLDFSSEFDLVTAVWEFSGLAAAQGTGNLDIQFRYDAENLGDHTESDLLLWQNDGSGWYEVTSTLSESDNILSASSLTTSGDNTYFAIGAIPEPTTALLLLIGGCTLITRRHIRGTGF